jgi:hypothetical protein
MASTDDPGHRPAGKGVLAAACVSALAVNANTSAVTILLPSISEDVGEPIAELQWAVTGYSQECTQHAQRRVHTLARIGGSDSMSRVSDRDALWPRCALLLAAVTASVAVQGAVPPGGVQQVIVKHCSAQASLSRSGSRG